MVYKNKEARETIVKKLIVSTQICIHIVPLLVHMGDAGDKIDPNRLQYELTRTDHEELSYTADRNIIRSHIEELRSVSAPWIVN